MTFFSIIWLAIVLWCFSRRDIKYMLFITLLFMTFQCDNVIEIGETGIGPQLLTSVLFMVKVLFNSGGKIYLPKRCGRVLIAVYLLLAAVLASCFYNGIFVDKILNIGQLTIYILCFTFILMGASTVDGETLYRMLRTIVIFLLVMGMLQLLTTTGVLPFRSILKVLFYNDDSTTVYFNHTGYSRIMSTFMEPSYFAGLLVGAFYYFLSLRGKWRENYILLLAIFVELMLTVSSTAYVAFAVVGVVFILLQDRINIQTKMIVVVVAAVGFAVLYFGFYDLLDSAIFSKTESGSYLTRTNMNNSAYKSYLDSVWFGTGYKNARGSSIFYSLLAETGRLGLGAYFLLNLIVMLPLFTGAFMRRRVSNQHIGILFAVLSIFVCQLVACPDVDLCTYWFWIYVLGVSLKEGGLDEVSRGSMNVCYRNE
ncbi:MAG: O-antigen ligase family protein [Ruminococcus sp.]|nr:O-antigen ligase family protein [Ruminococcus sp.]